MPGSKAAKAPKGATGGTKTTGGSQPKSGSSVTSGKNMKKDEKTSAEKRIEILERENMMLRKKLNIAEIKKEFQKSGVQESDMSSMFFDSLHDLELKVQQYESKAGEHVSGNFTDLEKDLQNERAKIKSLEKDLMEKTKHINEKDKELRAAKTEIQEQKDFTRTSEDAIKSELATVKSELETVKRSLKITENELDRHINKIPETLGKRHSRDTIDRLEKLQTEYDALKQQITEKDLKIKEQSNELMALKNKPPESQRPAMNVQEEITEIEKLRAELRDSNIKKDEQTANLEELTKSLDQNKTTLRETEANLQATKKSLDDKDRIIEELQKKIAELQNRSVEKLKNEKLVVDPKRDGSTKMETKSLVGKCETTESELQKAKEEIDELKNRLSKVVGASIMNDNPNITDLSDENRPTKLSEKFSELYDNEWTDAYEEVENEYHSEEKIIAHLYQLLEDIFDFCKKISEEHAKTIQACVLTVPYAVKGRPKSAMIGITHQRQLKELRKGFAPYLVDHVFEHFVHTLKIELAGKKKTENFIKKCVEICWLMNSQDPPVIFYNDNDKGKEFDGDKYRTYTKSGKIVDYVVWPPMLLHKDGPLLCKGVAQGK